MKQIIPYTLLAVCLLSACQTDDYEPTAETSGESGMLSLTVSANDFAVTGGASTRAADNGKTTTFENGDRVGLIVLNTTGDIIADNLPYKFDGSNWNFDTGNGEGKQPVFYDPSMSSYIVYYPYNASVDGTKSVDALKALNVFAPQEDQSTENAYRQSDLMVWSSSGKPMKQITAALAHVRNSFSLDAKVQWTLATGDMVSYTPPTLEDVIIYDKEGTQLSPYRAEDGSYRYILPDNYEGRMRWHYTYGEETYGGECTVSAQATGTRYAQVKTVNAGEYSLDKAAPGDFYCSKETGEANTGYVVPQEAVSVLEQHRCIGIVFHVGQHDSDDADYTQSGIGQQKCHGYVVALTEATSGYCMWGVYGKELGCCPTDAGGNKLNNYSNPDIDWNGYAWTQKIITAAGGKGNLNASDQAGYPATYYAVVAYETGCNAPTNSSGWFLPSIGQMWNIYQNRSSLFNGKAVVTSLKSDWYWSSSEHYRSPARSALYVSVSGGYVNYYDKDYRFSYVRPVLAF